jgi:hypothetical protein
MGRAADDIVAAVASDPDAIRTGPRKVTGVKNRSTGPRSRTAARVSVL